MRIAVYAFDGVTMFHLSIPQMVFGTVSRLGLGAFTDHRPRLLADHHLHPHLGGLYPQRTGRSGVGAGGRRRRGPRLVRRRSRGRGLTALAAEGGS